MSQRCACVVVSVILAVSLVQADPVSVKPQDVLFYQDFDHGAVVLCRGGWAGEMALRSEALVPGRFGKGYRMERGRTNFLTPNQASVEEGTEGFVPGDGVKLESVACKTAFGRKALVARCTAPGVVWRLAPRALEVKGRHRPNKMFALSAYLRAEKPGTKIRLSLADENENTDWRAKIETDNKAALAKDKNAKVKPILDTTSTAGEIVLGTEWKRVAAFLEIDTRRKEQSLVGTLEILEGAPGTVFADGLQLEQVAAYPLKSTDPTTWIPGGETRGPAWLEFFAGDTGFDGKQGTLAGWVRPIPDQAGGKRSVRSAAIIGTGWFTPGWQIGGPRWYASIKPATRNKIGKFSGAAVEKQLFEPSRWDGWHFLTLAWDEKEAVGYLDGKPFGKAEVQAEAPAINTVIRLGGTFLERSPMTGDLDEVFLLKERMSDAEVAALAERPTPLSADMPKWLIALPVRTTFLRSEADAELCLKPVRYAAEAPPVAMRARLPAFQVETSEPATHDKALTLRFKPWLVEPGSYELTVTTVAGDSTVPLRASVDVFEQPPSPEFIIYAWGNNEDLGDRGFTCGIGRSRGLQRELLERGLWCTTRIDVRDGVPHPWSPETRRRAKPIAQAVARAAMANPNVVQCLVNSEVGNPPFPTDKKWFLEWMERETGLREIPAAVARRPIRIPPEYTKDLPAVLPENCPPLKFCRWWRERGQGYWLLGGQLARWMRETGLRARYYADQPEALTQFREMDLVDFWAYPKTPYGLVARFNRPSSMARLMGKPFQAMPGTLFWDDGNGLWVNEDGKRKVLCLSPDLLKEHLWISVAAPTTSIGLYGMGERRTGVYDKACDTAMTETYKIIRPIGVLVGGLPAEQAQAALLETDGQLFIQPDVKDKWMHHWLNRTASRCLAKYRLDFDTITDDHVEAGWLDRYEAVVLPGAWCLPQKTHEALVAFARKGGQVITDEVLRAEIPGAKRLPIETQGYPADVVERELGAWARTFRDGHPGWARVTPADRVHTYTREDGPARYLFIINDHREPGPLEEKWKVMLNGVGRLRNEKLCDRGLPQDVTVTVPKGVALYDVLGHRCIDTKEEGDKQTCSLHLEPATTAVVAALPTAIDRLEVTASATMQPGTEGELTIRVLDAAGKPVPGRQLAEITVTSPDGPWPGMQRYHRIVAGSLTVPLRLPLTSKPGRWTVEVLEWVSGLRAKKQIDVMGK